MGMLARDGTVIRGKNINPKRNMSPWTSQKLISVSLFIAPSVQYRPLPWPNGRFRMFAGRAAAVEKGRCLHA